jgi:hypothetical protein
MGNFLSRDPLKKLPFYERELESLSSQEKEVQVG